jgi:hypothetical protein
VFNSDLPFPFHLIFLVSITIIMSRTYSFVTNNNGFWIGWLDLLTPFFTITLNHNQLQQLTIIDCLRLAPFWLDYDCLFFYWWITSDLRMTNEFVLIWKAAYVAQRYPRTCFFVCANPWTRLLIAQQQSGFQQFTNPLLYSWTCLFNTQRRFVSKNRISAETRLPACFLETVYMSHL